MIKLREMAANVNMLVYFYYQKIAFKKILKNPRMYKHRVVFTIIILMLSSFVLKFIAFK